MISNMTYSKLYSIVLPYFITRGADMSGGLQNIENYIHLGLQSAIVYKDWSFMTKNEKIESVKVGNKYRYNIINRVDSINFIKDRVGEDIYIHTDFELKGDTTGDYIETDSDYSELIIEYYIGYEWISIGSDNDKMIPFPNSFLPALINLIYDVGSPLQAFEGEQKPRWQIADKYLKMLAEKDGLQKAGHITY